MDIITKTEALMKLFTKDVANKKYVIDGCSLSSLAKEYSTSIATIKKILNKYNININTTLNDNLKHEKLKLLTPEIFKKLYLDEGKTYKEIANIYGASERQIKRLNTNVFKIKQSKCNIIEHRKQTFIKKYGVEYARQNKDIQKSIEDRYFEKHGVRNPSQNKLVQDKRKQTFINKYGVENPFANKDIQNKILDTYHTKYGENISNPSQIIGIRNRMALSSRLTKSLQYGRNSAQMQCLMNAENFKKYINSLDKNNRNIQYISKDLNYDDTTIGAYIKKYNLCNLISYSYAVSSYEDELVTILQSIGITNIIRNSKEYLDGQEIDIYLPDYKFGIEIDGNYWHSELNKENNYHQKKSLLALSKGIFIYHIFEYEWESIELKNKIINQIKNILKKNDNIIYARNCEIKITNKKDKKAFLNKNHIQSDAPSSIEIGLYYNNELVSLMTFSKPRFIQYDWELTRFCTKMNYNIIGAASKLFNYFIKNYAKSGETIVSYSDITKTKGTLYDILKFKMIHITKPDYVWWRGHNDIKTRDQCRMKNEITEMQKNKYIRIFDAGHKTWVFNN